MDVTQIILILAVSILTAILTLVGYEVFLIFREFHRVVKKFNQILDGAVTISQSVSKQINNVADLLTTIKMTVDLAKVFFKQGDRQENKEENLSLAEGPGDGHSAEEKPSIGSTVRRFFTRAGKRLS